MLYQIILWLYQVENLFLFTHSSGVRLLEFFHKYREVKSYKKHKNYLLMCSSCEEPVEEGVVTGKSKRVKSAGDQQVLFFLVTTKLVSNVAENAEFFTRYLRSKSEKFDS